MTSIFWFRRDLRLGDNPGLTAAADAGPVVPVYILDPQTEALGSAPRWRLQESVRALSASLQARGSRLILRRGDALGALRDLLAETGADAVHWNRLYDPASRERDETVKTALRENGHAAESHAGHVLFEPWTVETGAGDYYKVYTPYWRAVRDRGQDEPLSPPDLGTPDWPRSDDLDTWDMAGDMDRGAAVLARYANVGEDAARGRLGAFMGDGVDGYGDARNMLARNGTSWMSEHLTTGEISARACWHAGVRAREAGKAGAETWLQEIVWRDFAHHLLYHTPHIRDRSWRQEWESFPWRDDIDDAEAWRRGRTGEPVVDAAMRQMYVTGRMHNRARMIVASYLTKHLMTHWKIGERWFADCLTDWDPASNALGWQWSAGSGPDATPFFRVFNPATQAEKFDPDGTYRARWLAERQADPGPDALAYFEAIPRSWNMAPGDAYPEPLIDLKAGRERALEAYQDYRDKAA